MARARNIKPGFFTNDELAECDPLARILFAGLWCVADRSGRLEDRPKKIKAELLPYDNANAEKLLTQLADRKFILRYKAEGQSYIQVLAFEKHQNPHIKEAESSIPAPDLHSASTVLAQDGLLPKPERAGLIPDSLLLIPDCLNPPTDSIVPQPAKAPDNSAPQSDATEKNVATWKAYKSAYLQRYLVEPVRNASVNSKIKQFVARLGDDAPHVAMHYVRSNTAFYVRDKHGVGCMLKDAEGLHTEWATGRTVTSAEARMADETAARGNVWDQVREDFRAEKVING
jgi:hypothetical protein